MDKKTIGIAILSFTAVVLVGLNVDSPPTAEAQVAVAGRNYRAVTVPTQRGGDALYVLADNGMLAVMTYDRNQGLVVRDRRRISEAFDR